MSEPADPSSYREFFTTMSLFHKSVVAGIALITFGASCVTIGVGLGRVGKLEESFDGLAVEFKKTNALLEEFVAEGTRWTFRDQVAWWHECQSEYYQNSDGFFLPEPTKTTK